MITGSLILATGLILTAFVEDIKFTFFTLGILSGIYTSRYVYRIRGTVSVVIVVSVLTLIAVDRGFESPVGSNQRL